MRRKRTYFYDGTKQYILHCIGKFTQEVTQLRDALQNTEDSPILVALRQRVTHAKSRFEQESSAESDVQEEIYVVQTETKFTTDKIAILERQRLALGKQQDRLSKSVDAIQKR